MKLSGLTQNEFGEQFGISKNLTSQYISEKARPKLEVLQAIAAHYNLSIDDLVNKDLQKEQLRKVVENDNKAIPKEKKHIDKAASKSGVTHSAQEADMTKYVEKIEEENAYLREQNQKLIQMLEGQSRMLETKVRILEAKEERAAQNDYQGKLQELLARVMEIPATRPDFLKHLSKLEENQERMSEKIENIVEQVNYVEKKTEYRPTGSDQN